MAPRRELRRKFKSVLSFLNISVSVSILPRLYLALTKKSLELPPIVFPQVFDLLVGQFRFRRGYSPSRWLFQTFPFGRFGNQQVLFREKQFGCFLHGKTLILFIFKKGIEIFAFILQYGIFRFDLSPGFFAFDTLEFFIQGRNLSLERPSFV